MKLKLVKTNPGYYRFADSVIGVIRLEHRLGATGARYTRTEYAASYEGLSDVIAQAPTLKGLKARIARQVRAAQAIGDALRALAQ